METSNLSTDVAELRPTRGGGGLGVKKKKREVVKAGKKEWVLQQKKGRTRHKNQVK